MSKILITGGAGFIGSNLTRRLVEKNNNDEIIIIDNLERGKVEFLPKDKRIKFVNADLRSYREIKKYFKNVDIVIHMASKVSSMSVYLEKPYEIMSENIKIDSNVLKASLENNVKKYLYASSAHIYPKDLQKTLKPDKIKEDQAYPADCELSYGWAKLIGEKQVEFASHENDFFSCAIARFVGIYGKNQDFNLKTGSVIPVFSYRAIKYPAIDFNILGSGEETRSYCFIEDTLDCIELMIDKMNNQKIVGPLNVGKEELVSIKEIAKIIIDISEKNIQPNFDLKKIPVIFGQWCDTSKSKNLLGWEAKTKLYDGLKIVFNDIMERIKNEK